MALLLEVKPAEGPVSRVRLEAGRNRFSVRAGDTFRIYDDQTGLTPPGIAVKRIDNSLVIDGLPGSREPAVVEFADFYTLCSVGSPCELLVQQQAATAPIAITPGTPSIGALADGAFVLYDPSYVAPPEAAQAGGVDTRTMLYGAGAFAVAGLALGGGGGGGGSGDPGPGSAPPPDGTLRLTSSTATNSRTPLITGEGEPGAKIVVRIDTDADGVPNVSYGAIVGSDFRWSVDLAAATPESGALPAAGLPDLSTVGITSTSAAGNISLPTFQLAFDGTAPAPATIDAIAADNVVNASEKQAGVLVSGSAEPGSTVLLTWGAHTAATAVDAAGRWQTLVETGDIPADGAQPISVTVQDPAGNRSAPSPLAVSVDTAPPPLTVSSVAGGDNLVSIADAARVRFAGATEAGAAVNLQWNGLDKPATAGGDGQWAVEFTAAEVPAGAGEAIPYTIAATNAIGNVARVDGQVVVDRVAPAAPAIAAVEGDDRVTVAERADGVSVFGAAEAGARVAVSWGNASRTVTADGNGNWVGSFAPAELPSVGSPGASTLITATPTDAVGNAGPAGSRAVFVEQPFAPPTIAVVAGNDVVSAAERAGGITLSGTVQAGAPGVAVTWGGFSGAAGVANGNWQITVPAGLVPADGNTSVTASIAGSPQIAASRAVRIDTTPPAAPAIGPVEGDDRVTLAERQDGVRVSGTAEAGATVRVDWGSNGKVVTAGGNGAWAADFTAGEVPAAGLGGGNTTITARATDPQGNAGAQAQRTVFVEQPFNPPTIAVVEGNDTVSFAERSDGVVLSGTLQPGASGVAVSWGGFSGTATVAGGAWSITVAPGQVPADGVSAVVATISGVGGGASASRPVTIDTTGPPSSVAPVTGDDVISAAERIGFTVSGASEPNASLVVTVGSGTQTATANAAGAWTTGLFGGLDLPVGGGSVTLTAVATDQQGNQGPPLTRAISVEASPFAISPQEVFSPQPGPGPAGATPPGGGWGALTGEPLLALDDPVRHLA